jgi:hypothetical protein
MTIHSHLAHPTLSPVPLLRKDDRHHSRPLRRRRQESRLSKIQHCKAPGTELSRFSKRDLGKEESNPSPLTHVPLKVIRYAPYPSVVWYRRPPTERSSLFKTHSNNHQQRLIPDGRRGFVQFYTLSSSLDFASVASYLRFSV